jgi:hypothetical protein
MVHRQLESHRHQSRDESVGARFKNRARAFRQFCQPINQYFHPPMMAETTAGEKFQPSAAGHPQVCFSRFRR